MSNKPWWWITLRFSVTFSAGDLWIGVRIEPRAVLIQPLPTLGLLVAWRPYEGER